MSTGPTRDVLAQLAALLRERSSIDARITEIIGRPALLGHVGEFIAGVIFDIELETAANTKGFDGRFASGPLAGRTVNIKWYARHERMLDLHADPDAEFYLVLAGPSGFSAIRPWLIDAVFLFETRALLPMIRSRIGTATSVRRPLWDDAEIYPRQRMPLIRLSDTQRELLALFGSATTPAVRA